MPRAWANKFPIPETRFVSDFRGDYNAMLDGALSCHIGPDEPPQLFNGMLWLDTSSSPALFKQRKSDGSGWATRAEADTDYGGAMPLDGGTMRGPIDMGTFAITNLPAGSGNAPARYSDLTPYARIDGSAPFTGAVTLPGSNPTQDNHAARKLYVDQKAVAGGSFTGQIDMTVAPSANNHVMRRIDVDNWFQSHTHVGGSNGPRISAAGMSSAGALQGTVHTADHQGGVWFSEPTARSPYEICKKVSITSFVGSATKGVFKTVDLSGEVDVRCGRVQLQAMIGASGYSLITTPHAHIAVRRPGSGSTFASLPKTTVHIGADSTPMDYDDMDQPKTSFAAPLDALYTFEIAFDCGALSHGSAKLSLWLVGWQ